MNPLYPAMASLVLALHLTFILFVVFGAILAYSRPRLRWFHILCLLWGVLVELTPWPCPLTVLENWFEVQAGVRPYQGGFLLHYLDATVYPDVSPAILTIVGVAVCVLNLSLYGWMLYGRLRPRH